MTTPQGLLGRVGSLGGYCALAPPGAPGRWRPLEELVVSPSALARRAARLRAGLAVGAGVPVAEIDARAAASTVHLGLAARLVSPVLAVTLLGGVVPALDGGRWRWREPRDGEPSIGLAVHELVGRPGRGIREQADALRELLLVPVLLPLEDAVHDGCGVSRRVLRGNLASALAGAVTGLGTADRALRRPAGELAEALLSGSELAGHGGYDGAGAFRRRSCCLYYRLPQARGALCGDCVLLATRPGAGSR